MLKPEHMIEEFAIDSIQDALSIYIYISLESRTKPEFKGYLIAVHNTCRHRTSGHPTFVDQANHLACVNRISFPQRCMRLDPKRPTFLDS